jgi:hypothetical protein
MEIKGPGSKKPNFDPVDKARQTDKAARFEGKIKPESKAATSSAAKAALDGLKAQFTKRDLDDGAKVDTVIQHAVSEVLLGGLPQNLQLPAGDREVVAGMMANDPIIRGKLMNLLRRTLE